LAPVRCTHAHLAADRHLRIRVRTHAPNLSPSMQPAVVLFAVHIGH